MEQTSLITRLLVGDASDAPDIVLEDGLPDSVSLDSYFETVPFLPERAELSESSEETDQGYLLTFVVSTNTPREDYFHNRFFFRPLLVYVETLNGERHYLGTAANPCSMEYRRQSGPGIGDSNDNSITFRLVRAQTA